MEEHKTTVDSTPLLVNFLRLIRNGRQEEYNALSFSADSLVSFDFGGLRMFDLGPFTEAEDQWSALAKKAFSEGPWEAESPTFAGPLYLTVTYDDVVIEQWELVDYRDANFENSVPFSCNQLEALNTLVRIIYTYLRVNNIRRYVPQHLLQGVEGKGFNGDSVPQNAEEAGSNTENAAVGTTNAKQFLITIHSSKKEFPKLDMEYPRTQRWCIADLIRIIVTTNALARTQLLTQRKQSTQPSPTPMGLDSAERSPSPGKDKAMTQGKVFECTQAALGALIVSPTVHTNATACDQTTSSPSGSFKSQCTPSLAPTTAPIPICGMPSPSLLPLPPLSRMTPLSLPPGGFGAVLPLAIKPSTLQETQGAGSPRVPKAGAPGKAIGCDTPPSQTEVNAAAPPDFVRRMATTLFPAESVRIQQRRLPRSDGILLDTMAALPLHHHPAGSDDDEGAMGDSGALHADAGAGGSTFDLLELAQRMHASLAAARQIPLRDLVVLLNLE